MALADKAGAAVPYLDRLLEDRRLQRDLREAMIALRDGYRRAERKRRKPSRLLDDKRFKQYAERGAGSLRDAANRFRGEPPKSNRRRRAVVVLLLLGGAVALAARRMIKDQESAAEPAS
jgi:hypothetical protein